MTNPEEQDDDAPRRGEEEFRMEYTQADHYRVFPASSVRGGVQMRGDFLIEFFTERYQDPGAEVFSITDDGALGEHLRTESYDGALMREKQAGIMMSQNNAFDMAIWVIANLLGDDVSDTDVEEVIINEFSENIEDGGD